MSSNRKATLNTLIAVLTMALCLSLGVLSAHAETQTIQNLHNGNNFLSFHVLPEDATVENVFTDKADWITQVIGEGQAAMRLDDGEWVGNFTHFTRTGAYWIFFSLPLEAESPFEHTIEGDLTDPDILFSFHKGLNWAAYPHNQNASVSGGIPDDIETLISKVYGEGISATQTASSWVGSLQSFLPGYGYQLDATEAIPEFHFSCAGCDNEADYTYGCTDTNANNYDEAAQVDDKTCTYTLPAEWIPTAGGGQAFYILHKVRINGAPLQPGDAVGAFYEETNVGFGFADGEFVTVPALSVGDGDEITFRIYDASSEEQLPLSTTIPLEWADSAIEILGCMNADKDNYSELATVSLEGCAGPCTPKTCEELEATCGAPEDGCGTALDCGACDEGSFCSENFACEAECIPLTCEEAGATCGTIDDGCGTEVTCGACEAPFECDGAGQCVCNVPECAPEEDVVEEDVVEEDVTEEDTATEEDVTEEPNCDPACEEPECNKKCEDGIYYLCSDEGFWEVVEDCEEADMTCGSDNEGVVGCMPGPSQPDTEVVPEEDVVEAEEEDAGTEPETETPEEDATEAEAQADTASEEEPEEEEAAASSDDGGCGSCSNASNSSVPPRGGLFLLFLSALFFWRSRARQTA